jgi:hypothetical protein
VLRRLLFITILLIFALPAAAQTTTFNGIVKDLTNTLVATGQVTFALRPGIDTTTSGSALFVPTTTVVPTPSQQPSYSFVDIFSKQSIGVTKTFTGPLIFDGLDAAACFSTLMTTLYVGASCASAWGGDDIGSQINTAYAALPPTGGTIVILPQASGACYLYNTTINFTTVGKNAILQGAAPPQQSNGQVTGGSCIQYTHVTATNAINIDWSPAAGGGYVTGGGIRDLAIINSATEGGSTQCTTGGGCGSSANGVVIGATNGGAHKGYFSNVVVKGFNNGWLVEDAGGVGWGIDWENAAFAYNTIGLKDTVGHENNRCRECIWAFNGTNMSLTNGDFHIDGGSVDSAITAGINATTTTTTVYATNVHFENLGSLSNLQYMIGSGQLYLTGGLILDDASSGSSAQSFFTFSQGSMTGFTWFGGAGAPARTYTRVAFNPTVFGKISGYNGNRTAWSSMANICPAATCRPDIIAGTPFSNAFSQTLTNAFANIGLTTNSSIFYLRDSTVGGTVVVTVDDTATSVVISGAAGATTFVVGAPGAGQIGLQYSGGFLQIQASAARVGDVVKYTQILTQ